MLGRQAPKRKRGCEAYGKTPFLASFSVAEKFILRSFLDCARRALHAISCAMVEFESIIHSNAWRNQPFADSPLGRQSAGSGSKTLEKNIRDVSIFLYS